MTQIANLPTRQLDSRLFTHTDPIAQNSQLSTHLSAYNSRTSNKSLVIQQHNQRPTTKINP